MGKPKGTKAVAIGPERAEELSKQIKKHGCLDIDSLLEVLSANQAPCDASAPCKDNKKSNPNCLCALAPLVGSYRKKGLWAKDAASLSSLGDDPAKLARMVRHPPFTNLGSGRARGVAWVARREAGKQGWFTFVYVCIHKDHPDGS